MRCFVSAPLLHFKATWRNWNVNKIPYFLGRWEFCFRHFGLKSIKLEMTNIIFRIIRQCFHAWYKAEYWMMPPLIHITCNHEHHCMTLGLPNTIYFQGMTVWVCVCVHTYVSRMDDRHFLSQKSVNNWQTAVRLHFLICLVLSLIKRLRTC